MYSIQLLGCYVQYNKYTLNKVKEHRLFDISDKYEFIETTDFNRDVLKTLFKLV